MGALTALANWGRRHFNSGTPDYVPADSLVNGVRASGARGFVTGAGLGAVAGTGTGYALGMQNLAADKVTVMRDTFEVQRPVLIGADYDPSSSTFHPDPDGDGPMMSRWDHDPADWDPLIQNQGTGKTYTRDRFEHSMTWGPIQGALLGMGAGAVIGGLLGLAVHLVGKAVDGRAPRTEPKHEGLARAADKAHLIGAGAGAVVGGAAGFFAGRLAQSQASHATLVLQSPATQSETIGWIPRVSQKGDIPEGLFRDSHHIYYNELPDSRFGSPPFQGSEAVVRDVPTGQINTESVSSASHRLTPLTGALIGVGVGAAAGFAGGVATGVLAKILAAEPLPPEDPW